MDSTLRNHSNMWSGRAKAEPEPWLTACCPLCGSRSRKYNYGAHVNCWFGPSI
ncbi:hypothetical protein HanXRQr2_Chr12g0529801 [Helianthus annuus]|uniref:Uncharacterized protein n=1 Tax=Helianthus annuus TaxID=4232 RepID=A0A9K3HEX2_HELAN|nr:hypothetical protein HanXRQr2_Chr12g0529801 [Helianthus annuus]KAJ0861776.1 hypothetical protein HanPSC8_Chr12g0510481 [Helianthus annuus]